MSLDTLHDLFIAELGAIYQAESRVLAVMPRITKAVTNTELRSALNSRSLQTDEQLHRIELVFDGVELETRATQCEGMSGLVDEIESVLRTKGDPAVVDAAIISVLQRIAHYEISIYGSLREYASVLGHERAVALLSESLEEETESDRLLSKIARYHVHSAAPARTTHASSKRARRPDGIDVGTPTSPSFEVHAPR